MFDRRYGKIDSLTQSYVNHRLVFQKYKGRTLINSWGEVSQSTNKFIMDLVESGCDVLGNFERMTVLCDSCRPCSSSGGCIWIKETNMIGMIRAILGNIYMRQYVPPQAIHVWNKTVSSGGFIISSISSEPEGTTIHIYTHSRALLAREHFGS